jgi:hypothetical protein
VSSIADAGVAPAAGSTAASSDGAPVVATKITKLTLK